MLQIEELTTRLLESTAEVERLREKVARNDELKAKLNQFFNEAERVRDETLMKNQTLDARVIELTAETELLHAQIIAESWRITSPLPTKSRFLDWIRSRTNRLKR